MSKELQIKTKEGLIVVNLEPIYKSLARQSEVAYLTPMKAPELLSYFNESWSDLHIIVSNLTSERVKAERALDLRKSTIILEIIPDKLKELKALGINAAADIREAIIIKDEEYQMKLDKVEELKAALAYLRGIQKTYDDSISAIRNMIKSDLFGNGNNKMNDSIEATAVGHTPTLGFGKASYK